MQVGVGLPTTTPGATGDLLLEWARRVDAGPFSSLAVLDRVAYQNFEPFTSLAAAAAVTRRVQLATMILIAPLRNTALLAKSAASLDLLSNGRLFLGVGVGARGEDYEAAGVDPRSRGRRLGEQLEVMRDIWEEGRIGPRPSHDGGPRLLVGGSSGEAYARMARYAEGYAHGGGPARAFAVAASRAKAAWTDAGRPGRPLLWGMAYFGLTAAGAQTGADYLRHYYAFTGPFAEKIAAGNLTTPSATVDLIRGYEEAGCDELILFPTVANPAEIDSLADVVGNR